MIVNCPCDNCKEYDKEKHECNIAPEKCAVYWAWDFERAIE